ncbi:MAG: protein 1-like [Gammaproteobacteria bacterium]|nr:protein 1-like [Gammaproteobacteria bacterium]
MILSSEKEIPSAVQRNPKPVEREVFSATPEDEKWSYYGESDSSNSDDDSYDDPLVTRITHILNSKASSLDLRFAGITDEIFIQIAAKLGRNSTLRVLNLSENKITDQSTNLLALTLLASWRRITEIDLSWTDITDKGVQEIMEVLPSTKINKISFAGNKITDRGAYIIKQGLLANPNIKAIDLSSTEITEKGAAMIKAVCPDDTKINFSRSKVTDSGVTPKELFREEVSTDEDIPAETRELSDRSPSSPVSFFRAPRPSQSNHSKTVSNNSSSFDVTAGMSVSSSISEQESPLNKGSKSEEAPTTPQLETFSPR